MDPCVRSLISSRETGLANLLGKKQSSLSTLTKCPPSASASASALASASASASASTSASCVCF
jgi:hypothetical protein